MHRSGQPRRALGFAGLAMIVAIAGCGGAAYTKRDFIARADAICSGALRQTRAIGPQSDLATYVSEVLPVLRSEGSQLRSLKRPPDTARDRAILSQYFAALVAVDRDYRNLATAAHANDQQGVASAEAALQASPAPSLASSYGMSACGTPGATSA